MARKSAVANFPAPLTQIRSTVYKDFPACLTSYKWLVEDALKGGDTFSGTQKMFNIGEPHFCKVCGLPYARKDWLGHVQEHAAQLKLLKTPASPVNSHSTGNFITAGEMNVPLKIEPVNEELNELILTILDSFTEKSAEMEIQWNGNVLDLPAIVAKAIALDTEETEIGEAPLCSDCQ